MELPLLIVGRGLHNFTWLLLERMQCRTFHRGNSLKIGIWGGAEGNFYITNPFIHKLPITLSMTTFNGTNGSSQQQISNLK